jgi:twinkle protein
MNAHDVAQRLADRAADVAQHLLPNGKRMSGEWKAGSVAGEEGASLSVRLSGAKKGLWRDFAADEGGDLLDLWASVHSISIAEALTEARSYLGISEMPRREQHREYKRPEVPKQTSSGESVKAWLMSRGLNEQTIADFKVREVAGKAAFPYFRDGKLINVKYRDTKTKRDMRQEAGAEPCLFGWHLIGPNVRSIAICEGEIDAMTLHQFKIPALSVNAGAGNHQWVENDWERLERFSEIWLCFDDDEAGRKGAGEVANRLGIERCKVVQFGAKDANQWLQDGASGEDFHAALKAAKTKDPDELVSIATFFGEVKSMLYPAPESKRLPMLLLGERYEACVEFRPGEVSIWTGINGHGKSLMLNQVQLGLMSQGELVCVFSGEMSPGTQAKRLVKQASGTDMPTPAYIDAIGEWVHDKYWLIKITGTSTIARLSEVFSYAAKRYGVTQFVIDSLMMTDVPEDGPGALTQQKKAMQQLTDFAKTHNAHVHLVAHPRKPRDEGAAPGKMDVAGSGKITDAADNVFSVWSARKEDEADDEKPDALLELHKQRNGDVQHRKFWLYFNVASQQFCRSSARKPTAFVEYSSQARVVL